MFIDDERYYKTLLPFSDPPHALNLRGALFLSEQFLHIHFLLSGPLSNILITPYQGQNLRKDELWTTTCFETFIGVKGKKEYWEVNLSTDGNWNVYHFSKYRQDMKEEIKIKNLKPISTHKNKNELILKAAIPLNALFEAQTNLIECSLCSIIQFDNRDISYYSTHHAGNKPDFHLRDSFTIEPTPVF